MTDSTADRPAGDDVEPRLDALIRSADERAAAPSTATARDAVRRAQEST